MRLRPLIISASIALTLASCTTKEFTAKGVIPQPHHLAVGKESVRLSSIQSKGNETLSKLVNRFAQVINLPIDGDGRVLNVSLDSTIQHNDGYRIVINEKDAYVKAKNYSGIIYAMTTLSQLYKDRQLPQVDIYDYPQYEWRGLMLDVSRHYFEPDAIKEVIKMMSLHKLNKLHWHLTDGIGWRVQIDKYPALTDSAAWRVDEHPEAPWTNLELADASNPAAHGGFYTKDEIRDIVSFADSCGVEVIPEIEMPGHSLAILSLYPELKCTDVEGDPNVFCVGKEQTYTFLTDILSEVAEMFPSKYIHIGGDEVAFDQWGKCADCRKTMKSNKIKSMGDLQGYFVNRIDQHLKSLGKTMIGWNELTEGTIPKDAMITSWTGWEGGLEAAKRGNKAIMCPLDYVYFDHYQGSADFEPQAWGGANTLKRVYDFPIIPKGTEPQIAKNIIGGQANLWTENIITEKHLQYMLLPRLAALGEALWSDPKDKNWVSFNKRLENIKEIYRKNGWDYSNSAYTPVVKGERFNDKGELELTLTNETLGVTMRYTLDGSRPNYESTRTDSLVVITKPATLKVAAFVADTIMGRVLRVPNLMSKATKASKVTYMNWYDKQYSGGGTRALIDNKFATRRGDDKAWQGVRAKDFVVTLDFPQPITPRVLVARFFQHLGITSVVLPTKVVVSARTKDGKWVVIANHSPKKRYSYDAVIATERIELDPIETTRLRVVAVNPVTLPKGHPKAGDQAWVFMDEIAVN